MQIRLNLFQQPQSIYETTFPWLHQNISIKHLHENGKLLAENEIKTAEAWFAANPDKNRMKKSESKSYSLLKLKNPASQQECLFAIYFGEKQNKSSGKGTYSKVKLSAGSDKRWDNEHHLIGIQLARGMSLEEFITQDPQLPTSHWLMWLNIFRRMNLIKQSCSWH